MKLLEEGNIIQIEKGHTIYADVPEHFIYSNKKGSFKLTNSDVTIDDNFQYLEGEYIVYKTNSEGGGNGHGSNDTYPDGHRVYCVKITDEIEQRISFYQTGSFTAMIRDVPVIGTAIQKWTVDTLHRKRNLSNDTK